MVPDIVWTSFPERTASRCRGWFEGGPRRAHPEWVQYRDTQSTSGSTPHPPLPRTRGREMVLGEGFDDHHEDDRKRDHGADDPIDLRWPRQLLVGWRRLARRLERLDLPRGHPQVEPQGDQDQDGEQDQGGGYPAPHPPVPDRYQRQAGQQEEPVGGVRHSVI